MTAIQAWQRGNDRGNDRGDGYAVGETSDTPAEAAEREDLSILERLDGGVVVVECLSGGRTVIADVHGPWAVDIEEA